jgi:hypothetical protein
MATTADSGKFFVEENPKAKRKAEKKAEEVEKKRAAKAEVEAKAIAQLRQRCKDISPKPAGFDDDACYRRFLRARKLDVDKAFTMYDNCLKWRASFKPESITMEQIPRELSLGKAYGLGKDMSGRPVLMVIPARHDPKNSDNQEIVRALVYHCEKAASEMTDGVETVVLLVDFEGWGLKNADSDLDKAMIDTVQNYYPERLGAAYLINAPAIFKVAWAVVKPWLDKRTTSKINFMGSGEAAKEELLRAFGADTLPIKYGGKNPISLEAPKTAAIKGPPKGLSMAK